MIKEKRQMGFNCIYRRIIANKEKKSEAEIENFMLRLRVKNSFLYILFVNVNNALN